jgi:uncharacterized protein
VSGPGGYGGPFGPASGPPYGTPPPGPPQPGPPQPPPMPPPYGPPHGPPQAPPSGRPPWPYQGPGPGLPPYPHAKPEPYHRTLRTWSYRPWRPIVGIALTVALGMVVGPLAVVAVVGAGLAIVAPDQAETFLNDLADLRVTPAVLLTVNLSLALLIPITFLVIRLLHGMRPRWLGSVRPGLRWGLLAQFVGLGLLAALLISVVLGILMPEAALPADDVESGSTGTTVAYLAVILLTSPLQSAAEEYAFRGYLLQAIGALVGNRWVTLVLTALLFAAAHGGQNLPLFADRFLFGLVAGWLVLRTGGLEAGIALHVVNNVVVLALAAVAGELSDTLNISEATWSMLAVDIGQLVIFAALVVWWFRRRHLRNLTPGPPPDATGHRPDGLARGSQS